MFREKIPGWLYCLYNPCFVAYGNHVYKLGRTKNLSQRLSQYTTSYIEPSYFVTITSRSFRDSRQAEAVMFYVCRKHRVSESREFFCLPSSQIRYMFDRLSAISDDLIERLYHQIIKNVCPIDIYDQIVNTDDEEVWYERSLEYTSWLEEFFQKYRFRPKHPELYKRTGLYDHEVEELHRLLDNIGKDYRPNDSFSSLLAIE